MVSGSKETEIWNVLAGTAVPVHGRFEAFVAAKGSALQLPNFMATVAGMKPAMDDWVQSDRVETFVEMAQKFGLHVWRDVYFSPIEGDEELRGIVGSHLLNTTKAKGFELPPASSSGSLHVFLSKSIEQVKAAYEPGWYPLVIDNRVMHLPLSEHVALGQALGYPDCCIEFFRKNNDWDRQSVYYTTKMNSNKRLSSLCNCLTKSTPSFYTYHIPCSFNCEATVQYASELRSFIESEDRSYGRLIDFVVNLPALVFAENCIYLIVGEATGEYACRYTRVFFLGNEPEADRYGPRLQRGNHIQIIENKILVYRGSRLVDIIETRADKFTPEIPFLLSWEKLTS